MKRGRDGGQKRMQVKNLLPNASGPPHRSEEESKQIKKTQIISYIQFFSERKIIKLVEEWKELLLFQIRTGRAEFGILN